MTADKFRSLALEISGAIESSHMNHPDFRIDDMVFASLGYPDADHGMVKLTPEQQETFLTDSAKRVCSLCRRVGKAGLNERLLSPR
jgi:hypothetical protein